jgi:hypothetical protein
MIPSSAPPSSGPHDREHDGHLDGAADDSGHHQEVVGGLVHEATGLWVMH